MRSTSPRDGRCSLPSGSPMTPRTHRSSMTSRPFSTIRSEFSPAVPSAVPSCPGRPNREQQAGPRAPARLAGAMLWCGFSTFAEAEEVAGMTNEGPAADELEAGIRLDFRDEMSYGDYL